MSKILLQALLFTLAVIAFPSQAAVQVISKPLLCGPYESINGRVLSQKFKEQRAGIGVVGNVSIAELWRNPDTGTWTMIERYSNGKACVLAAGRDWKELIIMPGAPL